MDALSKGTGKWATKYAGYIRDRKTGAGRMRLGFNKIVILIAVLSALLLIVFTISSSIPEISSSATVTLSKNSSYYFHLPNSENVYAVYLLSSSASGATIYLGSKPLLLSKIYMLNLSSGASANVSVGNETYSDINVNLASSSAQSSDIILTYIPQGFGVKQSSNVHTINPQGSGPQAVVTSSQSTLPSTTSTSPQTTVSPPAQKLPASSQAIIDANASPLGTMINGFKRIFIVQSSECTQQEYQTNFASKYGFTPSGSLSFQNQSAQTPSSVSSSSSGLGGSIYNVSYYEVASAGNRKFATIQVNITSNSTTKYNITGDFGHTYSSMLENYTTLNKTTDPCAIFGA